MNKENVLNKNPSNEPALHGYNPCNENNEKDKNLFMQAIQDMRLIQDMQSSEDIQLSKDMQSSEDTQFSEDIQLSLYQTYWARRMDEAALKAFWEELTASNLERSIFYEYCPKSGDDFCLWTKSPSQDVRFVTDNSGKILGMYWLNNMLGKSVMIHFCFLREAFSLQEEIGKYVVKGLMEAKDAQGDYVISALMGLTPKVYRHVFPFIYDLGFKRIGILPKSCHFRDKNTYYDGVLTMLTRENHK